MSEMETCTIHLNSIPLPVFHTNSARQVVWVNSAAEAFFKESSAELKGKTLDSLFSDAETFPQMPLSQSEHGSQGIFWQRGSGIRVSQPMSPSKDPGARVSIISNPLTTEDQNDGFVHILVDASSLAENVRARNEFMMLVSHEMRAPLAKLKLSIDLLAESTQQEDWTQVRYLMTIVQRTMRYFEFFVENLLDIGAVQLGHFQVRPYRTEFKDIINSALEQIQPLALSKRKAIQLKDELPFPCIVLADPPRITQVIFNLLINAIKYGGEGKPVLLSTLLRGNFVIVEVADYGPGIPEDELELIFTRFYRSKRVATEGMGLGLGLGVAREIIEQHRGEIHAKSTLGEGTTLSLSIPLAD